MNTDILKIIAPRELILIIELLMAKDQALLILGLIAIILMAVLALI